jgi:hypothetical protein
MFLLSSNYNPIIDVSPPTEAPTIDAPLPPPFIYPYPHRFHMVLLHSLSQMDIHVFSYRNQMSH